MSEVPQGPGWWRASDGKWYSPQQLPSWGPPPPPPQFTSSSNKAPRAWYKKKPFIFSVVIVLLIVIVAVVAGTGKVKKKTAATVPTNGAHAMPAPTSRVKKTAVTVPTNGVPSVPTTPSSATLPATFDGNAIPSLHTGPPGNLDVTFVGTPSGSSSAGTSVPVEIWNGTTSTVNNIDVSGPALSGSTVVGSGDSQDIEPKNLAPGQVAFGIVYFSGAVPGGATFDLTASASQGKSTYYLDAQTTQANYVPATNGNDPQVVGSVVNTGTALMTGPISANAYCFSGGTLVQVITGFTSGSTNASLAPGAAASFSDDIFSGTCSSYLVGAWGFGS